MSYSFLLYFIAFNLWAFCLYCTSRKISFGCFTTLGLANKKFVLVSAYGLSCFAKICVVYSFHDNSKVMYSLYHIPSIVRSSSIELWRALWTSLDGLRKCYAYLCNWSGKNVITGRFKSKEESIRMQYLSFIAIECIRVSARAFVCVCNSIIHSL